MRGHPNLQTLLLDSCEIGDEGAVALVEVMRSCPNLRELNLSDNKIGDAGVIALAEGLRASPSLQVLGLINNKYGVYENAAGDALVDGVEACPSLRRVDDECDHVHWDLVDTLAEHKVTRAESRSATRCLLWCYEQLQSNLPVARTGNVASRMRSYCKSLLWCACRLRIRRVTLSRWHNRPKKPGRCARATTKYASIELEGRRRSCASTLWRIMELERRRKKPRFN
jgi:Leucine Rich repeat